MPISLSGFPALTELNNGEQSTSVVFNRPLFSLSTRTNSLKTLLEAVELEVLDARGVYPTLEDRLDDLTAATVGDRNMFLVGGSATWDLGLQSFTYGQINLIQPDKSFNYTINAGSMTSIADGDCLYVTLSRSPGSPTLTLTKAAGGALPTGEDIYAIAVRYGSRLWVRGYGEFEDQETREIGDGLTTAIMGRLQMSSETDTASHFTSTTIIDIADGIPTAISKLDKSEEYLIRDRNIILHGGGNLSWAISGPNGTLSFDDDLVVTVPSVGTVTLTAGSVGTITDGDVVYITLNRSLSNYVATPVVVNFASVPLSSGNTNSLVLGYRSGTTFVFRTGDSFQDGETKPIGTGGAGLVTYQNMSMYPSSDDDVTWDALTGQITCPGDIIIHFPWETFSNIIQSTEFPISLSTSGKKAYVILDRSQQSNLTVVEDVDTLPITYSAPDVLMVAERVGNSVYMFGTHRYNDGDIRRIGEGFVAGEIYDEMYYTTGTTATVTIPGGETHSADNKTLKVWANGVLLQPTIDYNEGPLNTEITAVAGAMFPTGVFPDDCAIRFRIESIVTGGAGPGGGGGGGGIAWSDPVDADIIPDLDDTRKLGSTVKGFRALFLSDRTTGDVYEVYIDSGVFNAVLVP